MEISLDIEKCSRGSGSILSRSPEKKRAAFPRKTARSNNARRNRKVSSFSSDGFGPRISTDPDPLRNRSLAHRGFPRPAI